MHLPHVLRWRAQPLALGIRPRLYALATVMSTELLPCALQTLARAIMLPLQGVACIVVATVVMAAIADITLSQACPLPGGLFLSFWPCRCKKSPKSEFYHLT